MWEGAKEKRQPKGYGLCVSKFVCVCVWKKKGGEGGGGEKGKLPPFRSI